jgi:hypothetical protein
VVCAGERWAVNFRAYPGRTDRNQGRAARRDSFHGAVHNRSGGGVRINYRQDNQYQVVYWDSDDAWVGGDLYSTELGGDDLQKIWDRYVG